MDMYLRLEQVLFFVLCASGIQGCPPGWLQNGSYCYFFSHFSARWTEADSFCEHFHAKLAEPDNQNKIDFLSGIVHDQAGGEYFMGGTDVFVENEWIWPSSGARINPTHWSPGEPTDDGGVGDCLTMYKNGLWNDRPCTSAYFFICETINSVIDGETVIG